MNRYTFSLRTAQSRGELRLVRDRTTSYNFTSGRLEVFINGRWGTICNDADFGLPEATVACQQLGWNGGSSYGSSTLMGWVLRRTVASKMVNPTTLYVIMARLWLGPGNTFYNAPWMRACVCVWSLCVFKLIAAMHAVGIKTHCTKMKLDEWINVTRPPFKSACLVWPITVVEPVWILVYTREFFAMVYKWFICYGSLPLSLLSVNPMVLFSCVHLIPFN